ncbi:MAG: bis(5'-nucleosyl)-tetraphosphatase (symmetrical) YqeK [Culicoidibacterales bacterium]
MLYYCSNFEPFTTHDQANILTLVAKAQPCTLVFVNDSYTAIQARLYMQEICRLFDDTLSYVHMSLSEFVASFDSKTFYQSEGLYNITKLGENFFPISEIYGYEKLLFADHLIFDEIPPHIANYYMKNEMFTISKNMVLVYNSMSYSRFQHTMRVCFTIKALAKIHGLDEDICFFTALFHDYAKEMPLENQRVIVDKYYNIYSDAPSPVWHGFAGALMLQQLYDNVDSDIIEAIAFHSIGLPQLSELGLALFVADFCEFKRPYLAPKDAVFALAKQSLYLAAKEKIYNTKIHLHKTHENLYWTTQNMLSWLEQLPPKIETRE